MKVAHLCVLTPQRCGLHETTRELVVGLRGLGIDSRLVDPAPQTNPIGFSGSEDRGAPVANLNWACEADIVVSHSGYDATPIEHTSQPIIHVCHGRPRSTFIGEVMGGTPVYSYHYRISKEPRIKAVVTFWPEHVPYHRAMFPNTPVKLVQSSVDLKAWTDEGPKGYRFGDKKGTINAVCTDAFRDDIDPFSAVTAFILWAREHKGAKLHVYGVPGNDWSQMKGWRALFRRLADDGTLGEVKGWVSGLANVYRAADFLMTPQTIDTRSVREAMACGCPVVRAFDVSQAPCNIAAAMSESRAFVRLQAMAKFNPETTARQFAEVLA